MAGGWRLEASSLPLLPPIRQDLSARLLNPVEKKNGRRNAKRDQAQTKPNVVLITVEELRNNQLTGIFNRNVKEVQRKASLTKQDPVRVLQSLDNPRF